MCASACQWMENISLKTLQALECLTLWLNFYSLYISFVIVVIVVVVVVVFVVVDSSLEIMSAFKAHCTLFILSFIVFYIQCELHRLFQFLFIVELLPKPNSKKKTKTNFSIYVRFLGVGCGFFFFNHPWLLWGHSPDSPFLKNHIDDEIEESNENSFKLRPNNNTLCIQFTNFARASFFFLRLNS